MASKAIPGRFLEHGAFMAVFALHLGVLAQQGEAARIVVKPGGLFPTSLTVTTDAVLAQRFFVLVIFCMARVAILTQLDAVEAPRVAGLAPSILMFATQHVFGIRVVVKVCFLP